MPPHRFGHDGPAQPLSASVLAQARPWARRSARPRGEAPGWCSARNERRLARNAQSSKSSVTESDTSIKYWLQSSILTPMARESGAPAEDTTQQIAQPLHIPNAAEMIAGHLRRQIVRSELREGQSLPPEAKLLSQF